MVFSMIFLKEISHWPLRVIPTLLNLRLSLTMKVLMMMSEFSYKYYMLKKQRKK